MDHGTMEALGGKLGLWTALPFAGLLVSIAVLPLIARDFWLRHFALVVCAWTGVFALPFLIAFRGDAVALILHTILTDYLPFIILIGALYTTCGGIVVAGTLDGNPLVNTALLFAGSMLASFVGTTGASMLLIRPLLRANASRARRTHQVVFFIFLVSNIGGSLTPLGDPPLFLGFLQGVPFFWTLGLFSHMAFVLLLVLGVFFALDTTWWILERLARRRGGWLPPDVPVATPAVRRSPIAGGHNVAYLAGIVGAVLLSGFWHPGRIVLLGTELPVEVLVRDAIIIAMALLSWGTTRSELYSANSFSWFPLKEVAWLFAGIFITMIPAVAILRAGEHGALAGWVDRLENPVDFFWATGILSSFLDNAPTYLSFLYLLLGKLAPGVPSAEGVRLLLSEHASFVVAISTGAVFMGANTYIGNAPNFMVAAIAEESGVKMPSFIGYLLKYSIPVLLPVFWLMSLVFF